MRIVSGIYKGRRLTSPKGRGVRPTLEVVREAIFDSLGPAVQGARVLDLFAGSGALGLEALSRGADSVTWCDSGPRSVAAIRENIKRMGVPKQQCRVLAMTALRAIRFLEKREERFDLVFVDPPYESYLYEETLLALSLAGLTQPGGDVVVEHAKRIEVSNVFGDLILERGRRYGETCVAWFERAARTEVTS